MCNVDLPTGRLSEIEFDFELPGPIALRMERTYRSTNRNPGDMGSGWGHSFGVQLHRESAGQFMFLGADGRRIPFDWSQEKIASANQIEEFAMTFIAPEQVAWDHLRPQLSDGAYLVHGPKTNTYIFSAQPAESGRHTWCGITDRIGNYAVISAGEDGLPNQLETPWKRRLTFLRNASRFLEEILVEVPGDADSRQSLVRFQYDSDHRLIAADDIAGTRKYEYSGNLLRRHFNRIGATCETEYDSHGRATKTSQFGGVRTRHYQYEGSKTVVTDSTGASSSVEFDENQQVIASVDESGGASRFEYDESRRLYKATNQKGGTTQLVNDVNGKPLSKVDPTGAATANVFDEQGEIAQRLSPEGVVLDSFERDELGQVIVAGHAGKGVTKVQRASDGSIGKVLTPFGDEVDLQWSEDYRLLRETDKIGLLSEQRFDIRGNLIAHTDAEGNTTKYSYDAHGYLASVQFADGTATGYEFDREGKVLALTDESGTTSRFEYDSSGRRRAITSAAGSQLYLEFDSENRIAAVGKLGAPGFKMRYDERGLMVRQKFPDGREERYQYDATGGLERFTDSAPEDTQIERDAAGRVVKIGYADGSIKTTERNDDGVWIETQWNGHRVARELNEAGQTALEFQDDFFLKTAYGDSGSVESIVDSHGRHVTYDYDEKGNVAKIQVVQGRWADSTWERGDAISVHEFEYNRSGDCVVWTMPAGKIETREYDKRRRMIKQEVSKDGKPIVARSYEYDVLGRVVKLVDSLHGTKRYRYRADGSLATVNDRASELQPVTITREGQTTHEQLGESDSEASMDLHYDRRGLLQTRRSAQGTKRFEYAGVGYLSRCTGSDGGEVEYSYDGLYRLVEKKSAGNATRYRWYKNSIWAIEAADDARVDFVWSPHSVSPIEQVVGDQKYSVHTDAIGRVMELVDDEGVVVWTNRDDEWGAGRRDADSSSDIDCPLGLPGQLWDPESELFYNRYRYYDPDTRRYISPDPIGIWGGLEMYSYVSDPINTYDLLGLKCRNKTDDPQLFRGDSGGPEIICKEGFKPQNPAANLSVITHVNGVPPGGSNWVATTYDSDVAENFGTKDGYVYMIDNPGCGVEVDCDPEVQKQYPDPDDSEKEILFDKAIPPKNIIGYWKKSAGQHTFQTC